MKYSYREVLASLPEEKRRADGTVTRFFHRPISYPLAWVFLNSGFRPNQITYLSVLCCLAGLALSFVPHIGFHWAALACFAAFGTLDCVDGNMARTLRGREAPRSGPSWGEWVDALGGYVAYATILIALGHSTELVSTTDQTFLSAPSGTWLTVGAVASASNLVMRLAFQSFRVVSGDPGRSGVAAEKRLSEEIGVTGWLQPLYAVGLATGLLPIVLAAYAAVFIGGAAVTVTRLARRVGRASL
jgi:phosphatidylglycerophosphate synthase